MSSSVKHDGSGRSENGKGLAEATICSLSLKHFYSAMFYAEIKCHFHQECGRPFEVIMYGRF
jgi:hypothetical protein